MKNMEEKLLCLYNKCLEELKSIGIEIPKNVDIKITTRAKKRYGCCKPIEPDISSKYYEYKNLKRIIKYGKYNKYVIEISSWVLDLNDDIIKNTIMHELIHCLPKCNNHGHEFKKYTEYINSKLNYNINRVGNKQEDYKQSNVEYKDERKNNYKIICTRCNQTFYRQRCVHNFEKKYRCGICKGKLKIIKL